MRAVSRAAKDIASLFKLHISFLSALSGLAGYFSVAAVSGAPPLRGVILFTGILFTAFGAAAINHYQDRYIDTLMKRTKGRPLPSGRMTPRCALALGAGGAAAGLATVCISGGYAAFALGAFALILYNAVYTPMKRTTPVALLAGALTGAIPPVMGWVGGGGPLVSTGSVALALFFYLWQVPHFFLLSVRCEEDYRRAGIPTLTAFFSGAQVKRVTSAWLLSTAAATLGLPAFGVVSGRSRGFLLVACALLLGGSSIALLAKRKKPLPHSMFGWVNAYALVVIFLVSSDFFV